MAIKLLFAGCGKMGGAMVAGLLECGHPGGDIIVVEPNPELAKNLSDQGIVAVSTPDDLAKSLVPDVVVFAVKPQIMDDVVPAYARFAGPDTVFLSIAAGRTIAYFEGHLGREAAVVRAMPNTPAAVGRGISVAVANGAVGKQQAAQCGDLLAAIGEVAWVDDEGLLDAVTALSGGGPAYVFLLVECLAEAGLQAGLPEDLSRKLARATVAGSGELLHLSDDDPATLRHNVTSPGGTTAEALKVLMEGDGLQSLLTRAIAAATARSRQLGG